MRMLNQDTKSGLSLTFCDGLQLVASLLVDLSTRWDSSSPRDQGGGEETRLNERANERRRKREIRRTLDQKKKMDGWKCAAEWKHAASSRRRSTIRYLTPMASGT